MNHESICSGCVDEYHCEWWCKGECYDGKDDNNDADKGFVVKDSQSNEYFCGMNIWDKQLRKAKIYHWERYAKEITNDTRFKRRKLIIVPVTIMEDDPQ